VGDNREVENVASCLQRQMHSVNLLYYFVKGIDEQLRLRSGDL